MKLFKLVVLTLTLLGTSKAYSQTKNSKSEIECITNTIMDYIEGTANGDPERVKKAFHHDFNLYTILKDSLFVHSGKKYISKIIKGKKSNRIGRIISIDYENDAAIVKAEIVIPNWRIYTDYFLLLKYKGKWKIIHKSYTYREFPKKNEE